MKKLALVIILGLAVNFAQAQFPHQPPFPFYLPTLTPVQLEQIKAADIKHIDKISVLYTKLSDNIEKLKVVLKQADLNKKDMNNLVSEIEKIKSDILQQEITHDQEIKSCLNESQKVIFDSLPKPFLM